jgi:hypothetical protein
MGIRLAFVASLTFAVALGAAGAQAAAMGQTDVGQISWASGAPNDAPTTDLYRSLAENPAIDALGSDGLGSGYDLQTLGRIAPVGAADVFSLALTNDESHFDSSVALPDGVHVRFGGTALYPQPAGYDAPEFSYLGQVQGPSLLGDMRQARSGFVGADWGFASWGGLGIAATQTSAPNGLPGNFSPAQLSAGKAANLSSVGMTAHVGFGDGWVTTFSYNQGITQLSLKPDALINTSDTLRSRAYSFAVAKHGLFDDDDSLGLAVTRPLLYSGGLNFDANDSSDFKLGHEYLPLTNGTPETDLEVGYVTTFLDGALALQANAGYQMNVQGLGGSNAVSVISRAKINF